MVSVQKHFQIDVLFHICSPFPYPDYTGSEENIDISVLGRQSKLNLPFKHPPTHSHKPEAYARRPGFSCSDQIHVDGAYLCDGVCACVCERTE